MATLILAIVHFFIKTVKELNNMSKVITKEYTVYDYSDLQKDDELCDRIYQKSWLENPNNINRKEN